MFALAPIRGRRRFFRYFRAFCIAVDPIADRPILHQQLPTFPTRQVMAKIIVEEAQTMRARGKATDAPIKMNQVDHALTHRNGAGVAKILEVHEEERKLAVAMLDHQIGLLHIASIDSRVVQAANRARDLPGGVFAQLEGRRRPIATALSTCASRSGSVTT